MIILNLISFTNTSTNSLNENLNKPNAQSNMNNPKQAIVSPTGTIHTLKGQILDISFLDVMGNLLSNSNTSKSPTSTSSNPSTNSKANNDQDLSNLDIDFSYLSTSQVSNSIADNFYGSSVCTANNNSNSGDTNSTGNGTNSSSSPITTPTVNSFVNPFSNPSTSQIFFAADDSKLPNKTSKSFFLKNP